VLTGVRPAGPRDERGITFGPIAADPSADPALRHSGLAGDLRLTQPSTATAMMTKRAFDDPAGNSCAPRAAAAGLMMVDTNPIFENGQMGKWEYGVHRCGKLGP
jgi:hypothetical protein